MTTTTSAGPVRINPTSWSGAFGYDQAQIRPLPERLLTVAAQGPVDDTGTLLHAGDVCAQLSLTMRNVETLLTAAGMDLTDVTRMTIYTTDVDATLAAYDAIVERLAALRATPPATLLGVTGFALPGMAVQIEVTAAR
jgi:enamine deaminase RidA (YjgF/YER057c/UK114 family)